MLVILVTQEGRDQEGHGSSRQIVGETLSRKNPSHKRAGGVAQGVGPEFKPSTAKNKKESCQLFACGGLEWRFY
jgi:hypothetical protein